MEQNTAKKLCGDVKKADVLVNIMERFDMLIPYMAGEENMQESSVLEFLVPCLMGRIPEVAVSQKKWPGDNIPILFFKFVHRKERILRESGFFLPCGMFHRVISRCYQKNHKTWTMKSECYSDYMEFATSGLYCYLRMAYDSILLCTFNVDESVSKKGNSHMCEARSSLREEVESIIDGIIGQLFPNLTYVHYLECLNKEHEHGCVLRVQKVVHIFLDILLQYSQTVTRLLLKFLL